MSTITFNFFDVTQRQADKLSTIYKTILIPSTTTEFSIFFDRSIEGQLYELTRKFGKNDSIIIKIIFCRLIVPQNSQKISLSKNVFDEELDSLLKVEMETLIPFKEHLHKLNDIVDTELEKQNAPVKLNTLSNRTKTIISILEKMMGMVGNQTSNMADVSFETKFKTHFQQLCENYFQGQCYSSIELKFGIYTRIVDKHTPSYMIDLANKKLATIIDDDPNNTMTHQLNDILVARREIAAKRKKKQRENVNLKNKKHVTGVINDITSQNIKFNNTLNK